MNNVTHLKKCMRFFRGFKHYFPKHSEVETFDLLTDLKPEILEALAEEIKKFANTKDITSAIDTFKIIIFKEEIYSFSSNTYE